MNKVWMELEKPSREEGDEVGHVRAELLNMLLKKVGVRYGEFKWFPDKYTYVFVYTDSGGYLYLTDSGEWFNLDKLVE